MVSPQSSGLRRPLVFNRPRQRRETNAENRIAEPSPDDLFKVLLLAAEGYVQLKHF